jgi:predicted MFS family arabinose efflux permease
VSAARIAIPGVALVGTTFGLARYGYGLLVPEMRKSFGLDGTTVGLLASSAYAAYLVATVASIALVARLGPRRSAVLAGVCASAGMALIARAPTVPVLALGVVVAGASSGLAFPPFADLAAEHLDSDRRGDALASISSGTGWGVALAAPLAIVLGRDWRAAWLAFAGVALAVAVVVRVLVPGRGPAASVVAPPRLSMGWFLCPRSRPLLVSAFLVGLSASVYWTFGPDLVQSAQDATAARLLFVVIGISSIGGSLADRILRRVGTAAGFRVCGALLAGSLVLVVVGAGDVSLVLLSGLAFGATYNLIVAIQVIWSDDVFAGRPSAGLAATMLMFAVGQILGPTLAGVIADRAGVSAAFALAAGTMAFTLVVVPPHRLHGSRLVQTR